MNPGGTGDDQNGWKLRVGNDNDANPNNATPANYDNPDGVAGTNDELMIGMAQVSFQQNSGAVACQTFYEYTSPGQASATFNNFDMDGVTRLRYYAPGDPTYDATATTGGTVGTMSGDGHLEQRRNARRPGRRHDRVADQRLVAHRQLLDQRQPVDPGGTAGRTGVLRAAAHPEHDADEDRRRR